MLKLNPISSEAAWWKRWWVEKKCICSFWTAESYIWVSSDPNVACLVYIWVYPTSLLHPNHNTQHPNHCNIRSYQKRSTKKRQRTTSPSTLQPTLHLQRRWVYNPSGPDASEISLADTKAAVWAEKKGRASGVPIAKTWDPCKVWGQDISRNPRYAFVQHGMGINMAKTNLFCSLWLDFLWAQHII